MEKKPVTLVQLGKNVTKNSQTSQLILFLNKLSTTMTVVLAQKNSRLKRSGKSIKNTAILKWVT